MGIFSKIPNYVQIIKLAIYRFYGILTDMNDVLLDRDKLAYDAMLEVVQFLLHDYKKKNTSATDEDLILVTEKIYDELLNTKESQNDLKQKLHAFQLEFENALQDVNNDKLSKFIKDMLEQEDFVKKYGEVFTPHHLIHELLKKLPKSDWKNPNLKWIDPACGSGNFLEYVKNKLMKSLSDIIPDKTEREKHICENMLYGCELQAKNLFLAVTRLDRHNKYNLNLVKCDSLEFQFWDLDYSNVRFIGNPPWNPEGNSTHSLYQKFIKKCLYHLKEGGFLVFITPPGWRKFVTKHSKQFYGLFDLMTKENQLAYLSIHKDKESFNKDLSYDCFIIEKKKPYKKSIIKDIDGEVSKINLKNYKFLPHGNFKLCEEITSDEDKCILMHDRSIYGTDKKHVSKVKDNIFCYPLITGITKDGLKFRYSNCNDKGFFGVSKVIIGDRGKASFANAIIDMDGVYGMTEHASGFAVESEEEAKNILLAFQNPEFQNFVERYLVFSVMGQIEHHNLSILNRKFYEKFIP